MQAVFEGAAFAGQHAERFRVVDRERPDGVVDIGMEIEGLAHDRAGSLYFGLRAPLARQSRHALLLRVHADSLFQSDVPCPDAPVRRETGDGVAVEVLAFPFEVDTLSYGIVSLEFDDVTGEVVALGNSPEPYGSLPPAVCRWNPQRPPHTRMCELLPETAEPYWGKQEALVMGPGAEAVTIFIDGDQGWRPDPVSAFGSSVSLSPGLGCFATGSRCCIQDPNAPSLFRTAAPSRL